MRHRQISEPFLGPSNRIGPQLINPNGQGIYFPIAAEPVDKRNVRIVFAFSTLSKLGVLRCVIIFFDFQLCFKYSYYYVKIK